MSLSYKHCHIYYFAGTCITELTIDQLPIWLGSSVVERLHQRSWLRIPNFSHKLQYTDFQNHSYSRNIYLIYIPLYSHQIGDVFDGITYVSQIAMFMKISI